MITTMIFSGLTMFAAQSDTYTGQMVGPDGAPVAGTIAYESGALVPVGADGAFSIQHNAIKDGKLLFSSQGYGDRVLLSHRPLKVEMRPVYEISGQVTASVGSVEGLEVFAYPAHEGFNFHAYTDTDTLPVLTDANGNFEFSRVAGTYSIRVMGKGRDGDEQVVKLVEGTPVTGLSLAARPGNEVTFSLNSNSTCHEEGSVHMVHSATAEQVSHPLGENGSTLLVGLLSGEWTVKIQTESSVATGVVNLTAPQTEVELTLDCGSVLNGRVVDANGAGYETFVGIRLSDDEYLGAETDANGYFSLRGPSDITEAHDLYVTAAMATVSVPASAWGTAGVSTFTVEPANVATGVLEGSLASNIPLYKGWATVVSEHVFARAELVAGEFVLEVPVGTYKLTVVDSFGHELASSTVQVATSNEDLSVSVANLGSVSGTTEAGAAVEFYSVADASTRDTPFVARARADSNGSFSFSGISAGNYVVEAHTSQGKVSATVTVAGAAAGVVFQ